MWKADIYLQKNTRWSWKHAIRSLNATESQMQSGKKRWTITVDDSEKQSVDKILKHYRFQYKWYKKEWSRSSHYRTNFLNNTKGPYRCRYCNRPLKEENMVVDHLVPVGQVKKNSFARMLLYVFGIKDVNDIRNLVPSCCRCNQKKSDKLGFWYLRGKLGKYKLYWVLLRILQCILVVAGILVAYKIYTKQFDIAILWNRIVTYLLGF